MIDRKNMSPFADKKLESLDIVFENCEVYTVPADGIHRMSIGQISSSLIVHVNGLSKWTEPGELSDGFYTDYISLMLNEKGMNTDSYWKEMFDDCQLLKDRIKGQDITHFDLNFTDNTHLYIGVPWENGNSEWENKYQHNDVKEKFAFIDIAKDIDEKEFEEENNNLYNYETSEPDTDLKIKFSQPVEEDVDIVHIDEEDDETFGEEVPNYVLAAFGQIDDELSRIMWNINQEKFNSPFGNTGNKFKNDVFEVEAYNWNEDYDQKYNFKWGDYKVKWYKYSGRDPEANRFISPDECAQMLDECLESIIKMDIEEDDLFPEEEHYCVQCGDETNYKELKNGKWACEKCLNNLGKEQSLLKEEVENSLFEFGFDDYEDVTSCIDQFISILKYAKHNTTIKTLDHLINGLEAININIKLENDLLDEETTKKIKEELEKW